MRAHDRTFGTDGLMAGPGPVGETSPLGLPDEPAGRAAAEDYPCPGQERRRFRSYHAPVRVSYVAGIVTGCCHDYKEKTKAGIRSILIER